MDALSIGKLSKQSGVNIETIRYYEKIGVMPAALAAVQTDIASMGRTASRG